MIDERKISLAIPTWERDELLASSFANVYDDPRISEIVIVDDCSDLKLFDEVKRKFDSLSKVRLLRNIINVDCYQNKMRTVSFCNNEFCILLDSDNSISKDYIDKIFEYEWRPDIILTPDFAVPNFNFQAYSGLLISKENIAEWIDKPMFETMCNAANYFVNRDKYVEVWDGSVDPVTSDSIYMAYKWLAAGNKIQVVKDLIYFHRVHRGHYQINVNRTAPGFHESVLNKLRQLT